MFHVKRISVSITEREFQRLMYLNKKVNEFLTNAHPDIYHSTEKPISVAVTAGVCLITGLEEKLCAPPLSRPIEVDKGQKQENNLSSSHIEKDTQIKN